MERIAVLIPCYNEEKTIRKVVSDFRRSLPEAVVYVYDNNSTDRSAELALEAGAVVRHEAMQGKGNVIRRMFREVDAECYIMADGDDTYPSQYAEEMAELVLKKNADMVVGDRLSSTYYSVNRRPFHNFGNSLVRKSVNLLFHSNLQDLMTGYRAFSYDFVKTFPVLSSGFEIETEMSIHAVDKKMQIGHVVIDYRDRPEGSESKLDTFPDGFRVLWMIVKLYSTYRPLGFFGLTAAFLALLSTVFFIPVLRTYFMTGEVPQYPTLIVCGFTMIAAIQSFFAGLQLHAIARQKKQDFELNLLRVRTMKTLLQKCSSDS